MFWLVYFIQSHLLVLMDGASAIDHFGANDSQWDCIVDDDQAAELFGSFVKLGIAQAPASSGHCFSLWVGEHLNWINVGIIIVENRLMFWPDDVRKVRVHLIYRSERLDPGHVVGKFQMEDGEVIYAVIEESPGRLPLKEGIARMEEMGFDYETSKKALHECNGWIESAARVASGDNILALSGVAGVVRSMRNALEEGKFEVFARYVEFLYGKEGGIAPEAYRGSAFLFVAELGLNPYDYDLQIIRDCFRALLRYGTREGVNQQQKDLERLKSIPGAQNLGEEVIRTIYRGCGRSFEKAEGKVREMCIC